eukprot:TRINITY_DN854_c2_g2_i1.p1 TRINITY_DN854_c2_g2~~TRINITY_DN854_c2_g2_i1.p1  ORF type:complete len:237 (+),score=81.88 TRINITY_DN854_c2_g2_i1:302-1012(+)
MLQQPVTSSSKPAMAGLDSDLSFDDDDDDFDDEFLPGLGPHSVGQGNAQASLHALQLEIDNETRLLNECSQKIRDDNDKFESDKESLLAEIGEAEATTRKRTEDLKRMKQLIVKQRAKDAKDTKELTSFVEHIENNVETTAARARAAEQRGVELEEEMKKVETLLNNLLKEEEIAGQRLQMAREQRSLACANLYELAKTIDAGIDEVMKGQPLYDTSAESLRKVHELTNDVVGDSA